jgi:hypothetical protein
MQAFRRNGITFEEMKSDSPVDGEVVFLGGGGNFIPLYTGMRWAMGHVHQRAKEVILLPHTVRGNQDILRKLGSNVTIICREIESYRHVVQNTARCNVALGHDMAFHLDPEEITRSISDVRALEDTFNKRLLDYKVTRDRITDPEVAVFARRDGKAPASCRTGPSTSPTPMLMAAARAMPIARPGASSMPSGWQGGADGQAPSASCPPSSTRPAS